MLDALFNPRTVAIVGATPKEGKVGNTLLRNLLSFRGDVFAVNPKYDEIMGVRCFRSLREIPHVDLVVIAVPAPAVLGVIEECAALNIENVVVISAGFRESGKEGASLESELTRICRENNINLVGPNCLGIMSTHVNLNATFSKVMPSAGRIALLSQSGALILAIIDWALHQKIGFSKVVSLGNKAVLDECDFMEYLANDDQTDVIAIYLESIERGRRFMRIASRIEKPIVILKSGKTSTGARAASSHTGALAGSREVFESAMQQCGAVSAETLEELFDYIRILPVMKDVEHIAIITNSGGPGVLAADAVETYGLSLASFRNETLQNLRKILPAEANIYNPIDILGDADASKLMKVIEIVISDENVDAAIVILTPTAPMNMEEAAEAVLKYASFSKIITCFIGGESVERAAERVEREGIPNFIDPARAVRAISVAKAYGRKRSRLNIRQFAVERDHTRKLLQSLPEGIIGVEGFPVIESYGVRVAPYRIVRTGDEAVSAASEIGLPVALKIISPDIVHKSDVGCIKLNVSSEEDVASAFYEIISNAERYTRMISGVLVQKMISGGREVIIGMKRDMQFGPVIMFGLGGIFVEIFKDISFRIAPLSVEDAYKMMAETKSYRVLRGVRGEKGCDIDAIAEVLMRISQLCMDFPEIMEIDINPVKVFERGKGCVAVDFRMVLRR